MLYKYWYHIPEGGKSKKFSLGSVKTDFIDLGPLKLKPDFLVKKIAYEAFLLGRVFLRYEPARPIKDKWLHERIPNGL